jgi:folylpolyglutamate synthase
MEYVDRPDRPSILRKIGLYTSPHLRSVRERIQINNVPLTEEQFAKYFFETWDRLEKSALDAGRPADVTAKPVYFRFLTLMALHTYMREGVDAAIIECGIGGEYDSTNILVHPVVTGVSNLGIDHVGVLGSTIEEIAWHKAGIMKTGSPALAVEQDPIAMEVLRKRAEEKNVKLQFVGRNPLLDNVQLGLAADFQKTNASLAIAMAVAYLNAIGYHLQKDEPQSTLPAGFKRGLEQVQWGGRCETRREKNIAWYIDGGHTLDSIQLAGKWFATQIKPADKSSTKKRKRVLLFNQQTRDATALARALHDTLATALGAEKPFTHAVFCSNVTFKDAGYKPDLVSVNANAEDVHELRVQKGLAEAWKGIDEETEVTVLRTIEEAVNLVREISAGGDEEVMVLVTGSLHLVGGFLEVLETGGQKVGA